MQQDVEELNNAAVQHYTSPRVKEEFRSFIKVKVEVL